MLFKKQEPNHFVVKMFFWVSYNHRHAFVFLLSFIVHLVHLWDYLLIYKMKMEIVFTTDGVVMIHNLIYGKQNSV